MSDIQRTPHQAADARAIALAHEILDRARDAVLSVLDSDGWPMLSRIALQTDPGGRPLAMLSDLALHTAALRADSRAALLIDAPRAEDERGMTLNRPRLSLQVRAHPVAPREAGELRRIWVERDPRAAVYARLADFRLWALEPQKGLLNAGFGRAFRLTAADLSG